MNKKKRICRHAVGLNSEENRFDQLVEECGELIVARNHLKRNRISVSEFISEVADVEIMISQMRVIFGDRIIDLAIDEKLTRLAGKLGI